MLRALGLPKRPSPTRRALLPGAPTDVSWEEYRAEYLATTRLPPQLAIRLVELYGTIAEQIEQLAMSGPAMMEEIDEETGAIAAEVVHAVRNEGAVTLEDIVLRRTLIGINGDVGLSAAPAAADVLVAVGEWTAPYAEAQTTAYRVAVKRLMPRALVTEATYEQEGESSA
uniref:glycerol-3-phosphate dehydrogenase C-terminal domain-containing protein n=1 Tax=Nesterenkonia sp. YGD6 TaxID=2901231 RepID=UPI0031451166